MKTSHIWLAIHQGRDIPGRENLWIQDSGNIGWEFVNIKFGTKSASVYVYQQKSNEEKELILSPSLSMFLELPSNLETFHALYCRKQNSIEIGPVIGLITEEKKSPKIFPPSNLEGFSKEMIFYLGSKGYPCFLYVWNRALEKDWSGYTWGDQNWVPKNLPIPHFLYNRIHTRRISFSDEMEKFLQFAEENNIALYNKRFISKKDLYKMPIKATLKNFLPELSSFTGDVFKDMLNRYPTLFLKPNHGSKGRGIVRIRKRPDGIHIENDHFQHIFPSSVDALRFLQDIVQSKDYVLQEGIPLIKMDGKTVDFRILTHKEDENRWKITSIVARTSKENGFITNLSKGGTKEPLKKILDIFFQKEQRKEIERLMRELVLSVSHEMDRHFPDCFIELGIDVGITGAGKMFIIEINSKPGKGDVLESSLPRPSVQAIGNIAIKYGKQKMEERCPCTTLES